jgi:hypothetical protein
VVRHAAARASGFCAMKTCCGRRRCTSCTPQTVPRKIATGASWNWDADVERYWAVVIGQLVPPGARRLLRDGHPTAMTSESAMVLIVRLLVGLLWLWLAFGALLVGPGRHYLARHPRVERAVTRSMHAFLVAQLLVAAVVLTIIAVRL